MMNRILGYMVSMVGASGLISVVWLFGTNRLYEPSLAIKTTEIAVATALATACAIHALWVAFRKE